MINRRFCLNFPLLALTTSPALAIEQARNLNDELESIRSKYGLPALAAAVVKVRSDRGVRRNRGASARQQYQGNRPALRLRVLSAWKSHAPITPPGRVFHYANLGYLIAGAMIEKALGLPWEELIRTRVFTPLGLSTAGLGPQATTGKIDAPVGHKISDSGEVVPMMWGPAADVPPVLGPAGVAHMLVLDFAVWAGWNAGRGTRGPALVKAETLERIHRPHVRTGRLPNPRPGTPEQGEYALGWGVIKFDWSRSPLLTHSGSNGRNLAKILVDSDQDLGVVVLTNFPEHSAEEAANKAMEMFYGRHSAKA